MIATEDSLLSRVSIVLVNTRNPLNIGAVARSMSNFGFIDLRLVQPYEASFREARSAVGAAFVLRAAKVYEDVASAVADCSLVIGTTAGQHRELQHALRRLDQGAKRIVKHLQKGKVALLFGSEKRGLSNEDFSHCHWLLRIPTREEHGSMNLAQAVAVCLYELVRGVGSKAHDEAPSKAGKSDPGSQPASTADLERITEVLSECLRSSGYLGAKSPASSLMKVRRMVQRLDLSASDAALWLGMLRQMLWKLQGAR